MSDLDYYKKFAPDFDEIKDFLDLESDFVSPEFPPFEPDFSTAIVVDNVPIISSEKIPKLMQVLMKLYGQVNNKIQESDIYMPFNDVAGTTYGFCFIKFPLKEDVDRAIKMFNNFAMDKKHVFKVSVYADLDKYEAISAEYTPQPPPPFQPRPDPTSWLADSHCRDQFVVRYSSEMEVAWANHTGEDPTVIYAGEREKVGNKVWCDNYVYWSPQGTYLCTLHAKGVRLWGGPSFEALGRFGFEGVDRVDFSPCESYLITYRPVDAAYDPNEAMVVWDIRSGEKLRAFAFRHPLEEKFLVSATVVEEKNGKRAERAIKARVMSYVGDASGGVFLLQEGSTIHKDVPAEKVEALQDPNVLKWSSDGKYIARLGPDIIQVYELPSLQLLDKKSLAAKDVLDFVWSPRGNMLSYWCPADSNYPALINIVRLPDRTDICSRKLFDVLDGRMVWHGDGEYLCVHMTKVQGKKKSYVLMFFRVNEQGVPVEQLELSDPVLNVAWEPSGDRICIRHGEARNSTLSFYSMAASPSSTTSTTASTKNPSAVTSAVTGSQRKELALLFSLNGVQCNEILWSPAGGVVALAYNAPDACMFELHDVENNIRLASRRHDRANRLLWDPSGRFIASCVVTPLRSAGTRSQIDDGFNLYTFQGTPLCQVKRDRLVQLVWRPRPKDLLSADEKKKVIKNLRKYEKVFEKEDRLRKQELHAEAQAERRRIALDFMSRVNVNKDRNALLKARRVAIRGGYDSDDERNYNFESVTQEIIISTKEEVMTAR